MSNLKEKTAQGIFWSAINNGVIQLLNIFIGIFLARILSPADYGIVGVLTIFTLLAGDIQSSGFTQALINLAKPSRNDYNSVFWFNVLASVVIYFILFACAPLIASFFHQPCLTSLSRFVFLSFVVAAFGIVPNGYMVKNMMNREIAIVNFVAMIVSGAVGITLAIKQMAYWSLAWQQFTYITVLNLGRYHYVGWRPSLKIDFTPVRRMFPFSVKILITTIITTISTNVLTFIFGRIFPMKDVGNYTQANKWSSMASTFVSGTLAQIAQTVLVESSSEREREKRVFRKITRFTAFLAFPALFGLALISNEFILSTITQKWIDAVPLMQILCIGAAFLPFHTLFQNLAISNHRSDIFMWCSLLQIATQIITIAVLHEHGIVTMVFAYAIINIVWTIVWHLAASHLISLSIKELLADTVPFLLAASASMAITYFATLAITNLIVLLIVRILLATAIYCLIMNFFRVNIFRESVQFFAGKFKKKGN